MSHRSVAEDGRAGPRGGRGRLWYGAAILLAAVWILGAGPLGMFMGRLSEVQTNDESTFLPVDAESTEVQRIQDRFTETETLPAIVVYSADAPLGPERLAALAEDAAALGARPWVAGEVTGPIPGTQDAGVAQTIVPLAGEGEPDEAVERLRAFLEERTPAGIDAEVTGPAGFIADLGAAFEGIDGTLLAVALTAVLIILILVYRSPLLPLVVIIAAVLALALAAAVVYAFADQGWLELNGQSQGILFILVVGACTDYALLLVSRYREELHVHPRPLGAILAAVRGTVAAILASGGTVILGVLCLLASNLASNRDLGPVAALGIAAALLSALTFLPAVLVLLGRVAFWPARPRYDSAAGAAGETESLDVVLRRHALWGRVAMAVARHPRALWIVTVAVLGIAAAFVPQFRAEGTSQEDIFRTEVESVRGQETLERGFGTEARATPAVIVTDADRLAEVTAAAESVDGVTRVVPVTEEGAGGAPAPGQGPPPGEREPRVIDGLALLEATLAEPAQSTEAIAIVRDLRERVSEVEGADARVGGTTASNLDTLDTSSRDLRVVVPLVLLVVLVVLIALLRAVVAPVLLVATTVLSFGAALGIGAILFYTVLDHPGADPAVPLFAFVFLVALGIDYNIFLMTRAREEAGRHGHHEGMLRALSVTGGVITSAGIVLAATFSALVVIPLLFLIQLAFLVAFGVLLDALVVRSLLVPALTLDIGPRTWWPAALARRTRDG